jgi:rubrerythrin
VSALKVMPSPVGSAEELMAMAQAIEEEAARSYRELAARMRLRDEERLATLFDFLAAIEDKHVAQVARRASEILDGAPSRAGVPRKVPETFDEEEGSSRLLTPYRALAIAVRNEDQAFAFYSYLAAEAPNEQARKIAEELATEELAHAALLRRERRKAYHADGSRGRPRPSPLPRSVTELLILCCETERRAARYHRALAASLLRQGKTVTAFIEAAEDEEDCARGAAARIGRDLRDEAEEIRPTVGGALRLLEEAFDRYADIAGRSTEESVMQEAQVLAARAVRRLGLAHSTLRRSPIGSAAPGSR